MYRFLAIPAAYTVSQAVNDALYYALIMMKHGPALHLLLFAAVVDCSRPGGGGVHLQHGTHVQHQLCKAVRKGKDIRGTGNLCVWEIINKIKLGSASSFHKWQTNLPWSTPNWLMNQAPIRPTQQPTQLALQPKKQEQERKSPKQGLHRVWTRVVIWFSGYQMSARF